MGSFLATMNLAWFLDDNPRSAELVWQDLHGRHPAKPSDVRRVLALSKASGDPRQKAALLLLGHNMAAVRLRTDQPSVINMDTGGDDEVFL